MSAHVSPQRVGVVPEQPLVQPRAPPPTSPQSGVAPEHIVVQSPQRSALVTSSSQPSPGMALQSSKPVMHSKPHEPSHVVVA